MALAHKGLSVEYRPWRFTEKDRIAFSNQKRLFSNSRLLNYPLLKKLVIASIDHEYRPNFRSHQ